jgi:hypothetical protein
VEERLFRAAFGVGMDALWSAFFSRAIPQGLKLRFS